MSKPFNLENPVTKVEMSTGDYALHGDVIITRIKELPKEFGKMEKSKDDCLALGEATGHMHKLFRAIDPDLPGKATFDLRIDKDGIKFLRVLEPTIVRHQEHREITIPPGDYKIGIQREYSPYEKLARSVAD